MAFAGAANMQDLANLENMLAVLTRDRQETRAELREAAQIRKETDQIIKEIVQARKGTKVDIEGLAQTQKPTDTQMGRLNRKIHATAAAYGVESETSFREALSGILGDLGFEVESYIRHDTEGNVHGHPTQVEIDVVIRDGILMLIEIKSSMSRSEVYTFERIVEFYEAEENRIVDRKLIICPYFKPGVIDVAEKLGIEVFTDVADVS